MIALFVLGAWMLTTLACAELADQLEREYRARHRRRCWR